VILFHCGSPHSHPQWFLMISKSAAFSLKIHVCNDKAVGCGILKTYVCCSMAA
jgi:hypothetical protein